MHWVQEIKPLLQVGAMDKVMPKDRDEQTGKYTERYTQENFLSALESLGAQLVPKKLPMKKLCLSNCSRKAN